MNNSQELVLSYYGAYFLSKVLTIKDQWKLSFRLTFPFYDYWHNCRAEPMSFLWIRVRDPDTDDQKIRVIQVPITGHWNTGTIIHFLI